MAKSLIYMANTNSQSITAGGTVNFGSIVRRYGCQCQSTGTTPQVNGTGYYNVNSNISFTASAAGTAVITLLSNGVAIPGATASLTVAADTEYACSIPAVIKEVCACESVSSITMTISGVDTTVTNASIEVSKE